MSLFQTFRDGPAYEREARRQFWHSVAIVVSQLATIACMVATLTYALQGHYEKATFYAVISLWGLVRRGTSNGSDKHP